ncbi:RimK family alpha-L-glutamate ligase [Halobaculum sp. MBLA0147]|uniref:ATP-grasp domain-containing protein n=1 Tax=Halobaculum sp. MBLA0147 TaxID=3079934 RepID=UPI003523D9E2
MTEESPVAADDVPPAPGTEEPAGSDADDRLTLAVTTAAETFERLRDRLPPHRIDVVHVQPSERVFEIDDESAGGIGGSSDAEQGQESSITEQVPDADVGWVYPSRLMEGAVVDTLLDVPWVNGRDAVVTSRNKAGVLAELAAADVPVPATRVVSNPADESDVLAAADELGWPVVVKPNSTTRGVGVAKVTDPDSVAGVTDYLDLVHDYRATGDRSYLLQEYLPDATDYRVMVVGGTYVGAVRRELPADNLADGQWKHNVHRGAVAEGVDLDPALRRLAERAARVLEIPVVGVDLLVTDDRAVVSETNARPTVDDAEKYVDGFDERLAVEIRRAAE